MVCHGDLACKDTVTKGNFCTKHWVLNECLLPDFRRRPRKFWREIEQITSKTEEVQKYIANSAVRIQAHWKRVMVRNRLANPNHPWGRARLEREFAKGF